MISKTVKHTGLAIAALAMSGISACSSNSATEDAQALPGDYVAGVVFSIPFLDASAKSLCCASDRFGILEVTLSEDGEIDGTFTDYVDYIPEALPDDEDYIDNVLDVTGTVDGTEFTLDVEDLGDDYPDVSFEGTITPDGILTAELFGDSDAIGHAGGVVVEDDDELQVACGLFYMNDGSDMNAGGFSVVLARNDDIFGVLYDNSEEEAAFLQGTFDDGSNTIDAAVSGEFDGIEIEDSEITTGFISTDGPDYLDYNVGFTPDFNGLMYGDTEECYDWD